MKNISLEELIDGDNLSGFWDTANKAIVTSSTLIRNPKWQRAVVIGSSVATLLKAGHDWYRDRKSDDVYSIKIFDTDPLYDRVHRWLISSIDESELRSITAEAAEPRSIGRGYDDDDEEEDYDSSPQVGAVSSTDRKNAEKTALDIYYDGSRIQYLEIDGHEVSIRVANNSLGANERESRMRSSDYIFIECRSLDAKNAVLKRLDAEARAITDRRPRIMGAMQWGNFRQVGYVAKRPLASVVLKEGQGERILEDLQDFLTREPIYAKMGMPFRRGLLLEGAPGTGKSSVATALAYELKMDVYTINISSVPSDDTLMELVTDIRAGSILLLEDIDVASSVRERDDEKPGVTMSGILNALDGIATPHGLITILTTNNVQVIDKAILRPGRVDLHERVSYIDNYQLQGLCTTFLGFIPENLPSVTEDDTIVAAEVVECFKRNLDDKDAAAQDLVNMVLASKEANKLIEIGY